MKKARKLVAVLLTLAMVFAMAMSAFADETTATTYTITVNAPEDGFAGHTYEVYQLLTGDYANEVLSNVQLGKNGELASGYTKIEDALKALTAIGTTDDKEKLAAIDAIITLNDEEAYTTLTVGESTATATVPGGYYLIKDAVTSSTDGVQTVSLNMVKVVSDITIAPKSEVPSFEKKVKDVNDTTGETSDWQDSADYDIGDDVPFKLEGTVADDYASYDTYTFIFHDKEEEGLTFNRDSVKVYLNDENTEISTDYYTVSTSTTDGDTFEVQFADLKKIAEVVSGSKIIVEYTSTLNENAVLGETGNKNKASLEFSNNPNVNQEGSTDKTPDDTVVVFTYKVVVNKVDQDNIALSGAAFTLDKVDENGDVIKNYGTVEANPDSTFTFSGLDDGTYKLTETKTPDGYNKIEAITFKVTADHDVEWDGASTTSALTNLSGDKVSGSIEFTAAKSEGSLTTSVENKKGSALPETGGMGTTIFYVLGTILVLGAGVVLIARKRVGTK